MEEMDEDGIPLMRGVQKPSRGMGSRAGHVVGGVQKDQELRQLWMLETVPGRVSTVGEMLKALWGKEGYAGIWKGTLLSRSRRVWDMDWAERMDRSKRNVCV